MRFKDEGHVVSIKMLKEYDALMWFIRNMAFERKNFRVDLTFNDVDREQVWWDRIKPGGVYK